MLMTIAQYDAILAILDDDERTEIAFMPIRVCTEQALVKRGWIANHANRWRVTPAGMAALEAL